MQMSFLKRQGAISLALKTQAMLCLLATFFFASAAQAHFQLDRNVRIIHAEHTADGFRVFLRLPTPYVLATPEEESSDTDTQARSQFYTDEDQDGTVLHRLDADALSSFTEEFSALVADGHVITIEGERLSPVSVETRVFTNEGAPDFATLAEAKEVFASTASFDALDGSYVGDTTTDVFMVFSTEKNTNAYTFGSNLNPGLPGQESTENILVDYPPGTERIYRVTGILDQPIEVTSSPYASFFTFVYQGVIHIIEGIDHVLFVVCLALGAMTISGLLWRVTGFTLGHSVTLSLGFFGFVPSGAWFVPTVETGIALSIVYAAAIALFFPSQTDASERRWFIVTGLIGLLHGLGFSFVLHEILQVDAPSVWQSLLAFNLGVELGQVAIVLAIWPLALLLSGRVPSVWRYTRGAALMGCILISMVWVVERMNSVVQTL